MSFRTKYKPLTKEQKSRGVIYSSELMVTNRPDIESICHEVFREDPDVYGKIKLLEDVSFFKSMARDFGYNVINEIHR